MLLVDDSAAFRDVVREVVAATPGMTCVGEATSGEAALEAVERLAPALVIMDKRMPGIGGIEAARRIRSGHPETVVLLVSVEAPRDEVLEASGAVAFLRKQELSPRKLTEVWLGVR